MGKKIYRLINSILFCLNGKKMADWKMLLTFQINWTFTLQIILLIANINDMWDTINWKDQMLLSCALNKAALEKTVCVVSSYKDINHSNYTTMW